MKRLCLAATILASASPALADGEAGRACDTTSECGPLHCIDRACVSVENGILAKRDAMFGDGHGYVSTILVGDLAALGAAGILLGIAFTTASGWPAVAATIPPAVTGTVIHALHGRAAPAVISFFGWGSIPPTTLGAALLGGSQSSFNTTVVIGAGTIAGIAGAIGMTALDVYLARPVQPTPRVRSLSVMPSIAPTRDGLSAAVIGVF